MEVFSCYRNHGSCLNFSEELFVCGVHVLPCLSEFFVSLHLVFYVNCEERGERERERGGGGGDRERERERERERDRDLRKLMPPLTVYVWGLEKRGYFCHLRFERVRYLGGLAVRTR